MLAFKMKCQTVFEGKNYLNGSIHDIKELPEEVAIRWEERGLMEVVEVSENEIENTSKPKSRRGRPSKASK